MLSRESIEAEAKQFGMTPKEYESAVAALRENPPKRPGLDEEIELVEAMSLEELQNACVLPICRSEAIRSSAPALKGVIKDLLKSYSLEMLRLGYNPSKGDGSK